MRDSIMLHIEMTEETETLVRRLEALKAGLENLAGEELRKENERLKAQNEIMRQALETLETLSAYGDSETNGIEFFTVINGEKVFDIYPDKLARIALGKVKEIS